MPRLSLTLTLVVGGLLLAACSPPTDPLELGRQAESAAEQEAAAPTETLHPTVEPTDAPATVEPYEGPVTPLPMDMLPPEVEARVSQVRSDLAERLSLPITEVQLRNAESVAWPDASLACPLPGAMYAQVETPGYRITLAANGSDYEYHASEAGEFVLCIDGLPIQHPAEGNSVLESPQVELAKADLASRLDIDPSSIKTVSVEEVTWRDGSLGCPNPNRSYTQVLVNGSRIIFEAAGRTWHYHAGAGRDPFLCLTPQEPLSSPGGTGSSAGDY